MFTRLTLRLRAPEPIDLRKASAFQGVLFDYIDPEYASFLHQQQMHPYSQYLFRQNDEIFWVINTLTDEAYEHITKPLLKKDVSTLKVKNGDIQVEIVSRSLSSQGTKELYRQFVQQTADRKFRIDVLTPTAFKRAGSYYLLPEPRLIYQSLMNKYSLLAGDMEMSDEDTLTQISDHTLITGYRLRTVRFPLEGITLPGFMGSFTINIKGTDTLARYIRMLLRFGEYSGIGIKTAMGMGAVRIHTKDEGKRGQG